MMARFRADYLDLLDGRVATITRLVAEREVEAAQVALLSLESSSAMVGAGELAAAGRQLRSALGTATPADLDALARQLVVEAGQAALRLRGRPD